MHPDPKSAKKPDGLAVFYSLLGSARTKAAGRMLMKLNPVVVNFINLLAQRAGSHCSVLAL